MAYEFFFSYTRANNDEYLKTFFRDLSEEVRLRRGLPAGTEVGFFDQRELDLGEQWDETIVQALQHSRVLLAMASPAYFKSDYCGREWALFRERCRAATPAGQTVPPLLKSVVWIEHPIAELPPTVQAGQLTLGDPHALHNTKGVRHLLRREGRKDAYMDLLDQLAGQIIQAGDAHPLPPLTQIPRLADVASAFSVGPAAAGPTQAPSGPRKVNFIYVAAHPSEIATVRPAEGYVDMGGGDWRPFYPADARRVHPLLQNVASDPALDFSSVELPFGDDLLARIDRAWNDREIVVIVVDAWSLHWDAQQAQPRYTRLLQQLDGRIDYHWCVLVPWSGDDPAAAAQEAAVRQQVRQTFDRHARLMPNPMFYRDDIRSVDAFRGSVAEVLTRLKEEVRKSAPVLRAVPGGPQRQLVSGPSG